MAAIAYDMGAVQPLWGARVRKFLVEKWIDLLIFAVVAPALWLLVETQSDVASLETAGANRDRRLDNISAVLPDIRVKVAYEAIYSKYQTALIVTKPTQLGVGEWVSYVHVWDTVDGTMNSYKGVLSGPNDERLQWLIAGSVARSAPLTLDELKQYSVDIRQPMSLPDYVNSKASLVTHLRSGTIDGQIEQMGLTKVSQRPWVKASQLPDIVKGLAGTDPLIRR